MIIELKNKKTQKVQKLKFYDDGMFPKIESNYLYNINEMYIIIG